jgi:diguanylate cyclase (GGDEF)-like protein
MEYRIRTSSDQECWLEEHAYPIWDDDQNRVIRFIGAVKDITQRKQAEARLQHLATHDLVTDLPNRVLFQDRLAHALGSARRRRARIAVMFLDLDGFKVVNDTVGHDKGDQVLREVAQRLKACTRKSDTVARLGGDEFGIVLENMSADTDAVTVAEKILSGISKPYLVEERKFVLTASIGISICSEGISDFDTMMKRADIAMYQVKKEGKNGLKIFDASMTSGS